MQFIKETVIVEYSKYTASLYTVYTVYITWIASFPRLPFWLLTVAKTEGEGLVHLLCEWHQCLPSRQRRGAVPDCKNELEAFPSSVCPSTGVPDVCEAGNFSLIVQIKERMPEMWSVTPSPPLSTYIDIVCIIKWTRPSPTVFAYCNLDGGKAWERG